MYSVEITVEKDKVTGETKVLSSTTRLPKDRSVQGVKVYEDELKGRHPGATQRPRVFLAVCSPFLPGWLSCISAPTMPWGGGMWPAPSFSPVRAGCWRPEMTFCGSAEETRSDLEG